MRVFKFGGASVKDADSVRNVADIVHNSTGKLIVVVSAMGKTTNNLEKVVHAYFYKQGDPVAFLDDVKAYHRAIVQSLFEEDFEAVWDQINDIFVEIDWILEDSVHDSYDYLYDQIVSVGELVSTTILAYYLSKIGCSSTWLDARGVIITDDTHRAGVVDFDTSTDKIKKAVDRGHASYDVIVSQGFIGSTPDNNSVTLGREGSDYSAGIFSYCADAESMHIWKDVPGILTADPRLFDNTSKIDRLSYREAIEMTYYGAKVIHPKTIKPLQNKSIPLYVRPFDNPR
jgi:aspartate kinase